MPYGGGGYGYATYPYYGGYYRVYSPSVAFGFGFGGYVCGGRYYHGGRYYGGHYGYRGHR